MADDRGTDRETIEKIHRRESAKLVARLVRMVRDVSLAEDIAQDALVAALEHWPKTGIPESPAAWLMTTARNRAINVGQRSRTFARKQDEIAYGIEVTQSATVADLDAALDDDIGDDLLRLVFIACHPILATEARVALTLRLLGGLRTDEIARAFLVPEPTVAQRIVRAKRSLAEAKVPFEVPRGAELGVRLAAVLGVVYLIFNEGYSATAGDDWTRPALCEEALRLGRLLAGIAPREPEVHGLVALMEIQASRMHARVNAAGQPVPLFEQDRSTWDREAIERGLIALEHASSLRETRGSYVLQAAIAACHARALSAASTDWDAVVGLYDELVQRVPSPVIRLNRAVAVSMARGPAEALADVDALSGEPLLARYHLLPAVRADLLIKLGRIDEARVELERAASLTQNAAERDLLRRRAESLASVRSLLGSPSR